MKHSYYSSDVSVLTFVLKGYQVPGKLLPYPVIFADYYK